MSDDGAPGAELRTHTVAAGTMWLTQTPALSLWKGEVGLSDWLRVDTRDGRVEELVLAPRGTLRLGRAKPGMAEPPDVAHESFVSSQAALMIHDGVRWFLQRRPECHERVPTVVGSRVLLPGEAAPLVHGTFVQIGRVRATLVDRRYVVPTVPAGAVDPHTGLLGRIGFEQEIAGFLALGRQGALVVLAAPPGPLVAPAPGAHPAVVRAVMSMHATWPRAAIMHEEGVVCMLVADAGDAHARRAATETHGLAMAAGLRGHACGYWTLGPELASATRELETALRATSSALGSGAPDPIALRESPVAARVTSEEILRASLSDRRLRAVLLAIEDTASLARVGAHVLPSLAQELVAVVAGRAPAKGLVATLAPGVVVASVPEASAEALAGDVQREWHARPPIVDGQVELPRALCWEIQAGDPGARAGELSRECADPRGALSALAGGLPYPIAGRVALASAASSGVERIKLLFDVLEGAWRFVAVTLTAAYLAGGRAGEPTPPAFDELAAFARGMVTRSAYPLGKWRELARIAARGLEASGDAMGGMARELLRVKHEGNETLEALANQLHPLRNQFAHNVYSEARALADLPLFEQVARDLLRALRPLAAWTLVTIERTEPDLYGDAQRVEYVDHTGPEEGGTRRKVGLLSQVRLASVVYLVRWREGLVVPLEPFVRRLSRGHAFDLYWAQHLPRPGVTAYASVLRGEDRNDEVDERRLSPRMRALAATLAR